MVLDKINLEKNKQIEIESHQIANESAFLLQCFKYITIVYLSNEKRLAIDYLSKFSNLTRTILEMTEKILFQFQKK